MRTETNAEEQDELRCQEAVPGHRVREGHAPAGPPRAQVPGAQRPPGRPARERREGVQGRSEAGQETARQVTPNPNTRSKTWHASSGLCTASRSNGRHMISSEAY